MGHSNSGTENQRVLRTAGRATAAEDSAALDYHLARSRILRRFLALFMLATIVGAASATALAGGMDEYEGRVDYCDRSGL